MSIGNGLGADRETAVRRNMMFICTCDLEDVEYDGKIISLRAGLDRVGGDCELYERYPSHFKPVERGQSGERSSVEYRAYDGGALRQPNTTSPPDKPRRRDAPRRQMSLDAELAIRNRALAELRRQERSRPAESAHAAEERFWNGVSELLGTARQEREDKRQIEMLDALHATRTRSLGAELEDLTSWLDGE